MSKVLIYRENELLNLKRNISIFIGGSEHRVKSNETIELAINEGGYDIYTELDWIKSKNYHLKIEKDKIYNIRIKPFISNNYLYLFMSFLPLLNILFYFLNNIIFWSINMLMLFNFLIMLYYFTIGKKKYISLIIEENKA